MNEKNAKQTPDRHGHPITPGSAEGERETIEEAIRNLQFSEKPKTHEMRSGKERRMFPQQAGNRHKKAA